MSCFLPLKPLGLAFDALTVTVEKDAAPWRTWYFGYKLGLVGIASNNSSIPFGFMPVKLPTPDVGPTLIEYVDTEVFPTAPGGHYFYSSDPAEQADLDAGRAGHFRRTGKSFKTGGYTRICRFFGSLNPGPNSHFFSFDPDECEALKRAQVTPAPTFQQQWNYEGIGFDVASPVKDAAGFLGCQAGFNTIYRLYNNAYTASGKHSWDSNHRYTTNPVGEVPAMVAQGWKDEGLAFCVPG